MKKIYFLLLSSLTLCSVSFAQFSDDFESYTVNSYIGASSPNWTTWSGATGGAEDTRVVTTNASSGTKSLYFMSSVAAGGPQDCVLPFGGVKTTGNFVMEAKFFVETGKGGYFNLQGGATIGGTWAMECFMVNNGNLYISNQQNQFLSTTYPIAQWFTLRMEINLNTNNWELFINGVSQGSFANNINAVSYLNIYPVNPTNMGGNNTSGYWVDDVSYTHTPYTLPSLNGAVTLITIPGGLAGQTKSVTAKVRNLGTTAINSFSLNWNYNGSNITENISSVNITSLSTYDYQFTAPITLAAGSNNITVTISNVNGGGADGDPADDVAVKNLNPTVPAPGKIVVGEEGTGTWCGWCPRGAVFMEYMQNNYDGYWAGIAVHNGDPMTVAAYDAAIGALISGYPSGVVDRGPETDPSAFEIDFLSRITVAPKATMTNAVSYNSSTQELTVVVTTNWQINSTGNWKQAVVVTEDDVTGTSGYAQTNYYSSSSQNLPLVGAGHNWQTSPNPVPANQMEYDHVARAISPSFAGLNNAFGATQNAGQVFTQTFVIPVPASWNLNKLHVVSLLISPTGLIDNAGTASTANGIEEATSNFELFLYPNPAVDYSIVRIDLKEMAEVSMKVLDINGKIVTSAEYGQLNGSYNLPINVSHLSSGIYFVSIQVGNEIKTLKLMVE